MRRSSLVSRALHHTGNRRPGRCPRAIFEFCLTIHANLLVVFLEFTGVPFRVLAEASKCSDPSSAGSLLRKVRLIVADDNPLFLQNLVLLLAVEFDVVATAPDGETALDLVHRFRPDAVVVDLHIPMLNGIEIAKALTKHAPGPPVVICAVEHDPEILEAARKAGALAFVAKARLERDLALAVKSAIQGKRFVSPAE